MANSMTSDINESLLRSTSKIAVQFLIEKVQNGKMIRIPSLGVCLDKADLLNDRLASADKRECGS
jgi:hypothetical protein